MPLVAAKAPPCCHVDCCVLVSITHCRRVAGVSRLLHYHANVRSPQRRTNANDNGVDGRVRLLCPLASTHVDSSPRHKACARPRVAEERLICSRLRLGLWHGIGVVHVHASPKSVSSGAVSASVVEAPLLVSLTVTVVVKRSQLSVPLRSQSSTQVMPVLTHAILAESSSRASWSLPQQPSSCCRAPVSIHRTVSCSGVPTFTGPRHKWSSHRREFICPGPIREALLKCVLLVTSNCATSRNASSEHKLEECRRRRAMPRQRRSPPAETNLRASTSSSKCHTPRDWYATRQRRSSLLPQLTRPPCPLQFCLATDTKVKPS